MPNQNITAIEQQENGTFKELIIGKRKKFTPPTANRWYRILRVPSTNANRKVISGTLKIYTDLPDNKYNCLVDIDLSFEGRGTLTQTSYNIVGGPHISYVRTARRQGATKDEIVVDVLVVGGAGIEFTLEGVGLLFPDFEDNPQIVGSTAWNIENSRKPWDSHVMDSQKFGLDTTIATPPPVPPAGQTTTVDVALWFNHKDYATVLNPDIAQEATLNHLDTNSDVYVQFVQDSAGIKAGTYGGTVISTLAENTTLRTAPNGAANKYRVIVRLRGLTSTTWAPAAQGSGSPMIPTFYQSGGIWILRIVTGVFNGLSPDNPMSNDGEHQASILRLGRGLITNKNVNLYHGNLEDPGQPLLVGGRVGYLHALDLLAGSGRFTSAADHFHMVFSGAVNSGSGFRTPQHYSQYKLGFFNWDGRQQWARWQQQNANNGDANEIFLGGVTEFFFGQGAVAGSSPYGIDTSRVELTGTGNGEENPTSPGPPRWDAEVDFYFNSSFTVSNGQFLIVRFPVGVAGIAAAVLSGTAVGVVTGPLTAPDGATGKFKLTIRLQGLNPTEWYPFLAGFSTNTVGTSNSWSVESSTPPINPNNQVSLVVHPDRRDKVIATYNVAHGLTLGQNIILNLLNKSFVVSNPARLNCTVSKIINANAVEILIGTARRLETAMVGVYEFKAPGDSNMNLNLGDTNDVCQMINAFPFDNNIKVSFKANISGTTMTVTEMLSTGYQLEEKMMLFNLTSEDPNRYYEAFPLAQGARIISQTSGTVGGVGTYTIAWTGGGAIDKNNATIYAGKTVHRVKVISNSKLPEPLVENTNYYVRLNSSYPWLFVSFYTTEIDAFNGLTGPTAPSVKFPWKPTYGTYWAVFQDTENLDATGWSVHIGNTDPGHQQTFADVGWYLHRNVFPDSAGVAQGVITQGIFGGINSVEWFRKNSFVYGFNCTNQADNTITLGQKLVNKTPNSTEIGATDNIKLRLKDVDIVVTDETKNLTIANIVNNSLGFSGDISGHKHYIFSYFSTTSISIPGGYRSTWAVITGGGAGGTTATVTLPRVATSTDPFEGAREGDELYIELKNTSSGRTVVLSQFQFTGSSYTTTIRGVPAAGSTTGSGTSYTADGLIHLKMVSGAWEAVPNTTLVTTALNAKQNTLVSGTNIKTINSESLLGATNITLEPALLPSTSVAQFLRGDKTWRVPAGAFGPIVLNRFRNLTFTSSNYAPGVSTSSTPSSFGFFTLSPNGNTLEGWTVGGGTPRLFNPAQFFGESSTYRIFAAVRTTGWFNDGLHCMIRSWNGVSEQTIAGLQDFGGGVGSADRIVWATSDILLSDDTWFSFSAYFGAYGNSNNSNGAVIQDVILTFYKIN
jgi:hypothetical protein